MFSSDDLRADSFGGFAKWSEFDHRAIPDMGGVYVVLHPADLAPTFDPVSSGGHFKGRNPAVDVSALRAKWLTGVETIYIGKATSLRDRLRQYHNFGVGRPVGHWGGRYIWQLANRRDLRICWKATTEPPEGVETRLLQAFIAQHGALPFANLRM